MTGRLALGAIVVGAGVVWLLSAADMIDVSYQAAVGVLLIAIGSSIAFLRGARVLLVVLGVLVALAGVPAVLVEDDVLSGGIGEVVEKPTSRTQLEPFRQAIGRLTVDLTAPGLDLDEATVVASIGIGELVVLVPDDADISLDAHVAIGNAEALGRTESGLDVDLVGLSGTAGTQELTLDLDVGIGNARVERRP